MAVIKKWLIRYLVLWCIGLLVLFFAGKHIEPYLIFPASWARPKPPSLKLGVHDQLLYRYLDAERTKFVEAVLLKHPDNGKHGLIVFVHGNAMFIDDWVQVLKTYHSLGYHVLLVEFRGYGRSSGYPSIANIVDDLKYFYLQVRELDIINKNDVVYHGWSVGGGLIGELAARLPPDKIILNSTFSSLKKVIHEKIKLPEFLINSELNNLKNLKDFLGKIQIHHSKDDELINYAHAEALHENLANSELVVHQGGHNTTPKDWEFYWQAVSEFLRNK